MERSGKSTRAPFRSCLVKVPVTWKKIIQMSIEQRRNRLTEETACELLKQHGYDIKTPFGHGHAMDGYREWHICRLDELHSMEIAQFLTYLESALAFLSYLMRHHALTSGALLANTDALIEIH
jgi:hypothetical protein